MDKDEIIRRLKEISSHAVHTVGEEPFVMSLDDGIAVKEAIKLIKQQPQWRSIKDDPPKKGGYYLVAIERFLGDPKVSVHRYNACEDYWSGAEVGSRIVNITHWMPTPNPPEKEKQDGIHNQ